MVFDDSNLYLIGPDRIDHDGNTVYTDVTYTPDGRRRVCRRPPPTGPRGWLVDEKGWWVSSQRSGS